MSDDEQLLSVAREAIMGRLGDAPFPDPDPAAYPPALRVPAACFVTLLKEGGLRGCVGAFEARDPLVLAAARNAVRAAFHDTRFPPLTREEARGIHLEISILSRPEPLGVADEAALLSALRPGVDGLILRQGGRTATFLPSVWEQLPDPVQFVRHLKAKGGWNPDGWPEGMCCERYTARKVKETEFPAS